MVVLVVVEVMVAVVVLVVVRACGRSCFELPVLVVALELMQYCFWPLQVWANEIMTVQDDGSNKWSHIRTVIALPCSPQSFRHRQRPECCATKETRSSADAVNKRVREREGDPLPSRRCLGSSGGTGSLLLHVLSERLDLLLHRRRLSSSELELPQPSP